MRNLAGVKDADRYIEEELYLARIPAGPEVADGEVPYTVVGRLKGWIFRRAWYYYMVSCPNGLGLIYDKAVMLHEKKYPVEHERYINLGQVIRVGGDCTFPHPSSRKYSTLEGIEEEFVEARKKFPDVVWDVKESFGRCWLREIEGVKYIRLYHIDTQIGLNEFVDAITSKVLVGV